MLPALRTRRNENATSWLPSIFDDFFNDEFMGIPVSRQFATPAVNIREEEKQFDIEIAAPGMTKNDFRININQNGELSIFLEKTKEEKESDAKEEKHNTWLRREFAYSQYSQCFTIPDEVDETQITAKMENGVLNITLPKKEQVTQEPVTRQIEIL